jgi:phosphoesterase RecJ-like protein
MSIDWKSFCRIIRAADDIVLTSHIRPDCDALGSELGLADVLRRLGKRVRIVNGQATPPNLAFIDRRREILVYGHDVTSEQLADAQLVAILDTSAWAQLAPLRPFLESTAAQKIILDHHVSQDDLGAVAFKDSGAEATGRLVVDAADHLGVPLSPQAAEALFAALATDTGWFRFGSTTQATYQLAARLVEAGARPAEIYGALYERESAARVRLRGNVLSRIATELDGRFVHTYIRQADFVQTGALPSDTEDLINQTLEIGGTLFAVILVEQPSGGYKISFRSRCALSCNDVAARFGGGGHQAAAGAFLKGEFEFVSQQVLSHVRQQLAAHLAQAAVPARPNRPMSTDD